jgi:hypothetical protein
MISILHPSRSRSKKSAGNMATWLSRANNKMEVEVIVSIDTDDERFEDYYIDYNFASALRQRIHIIHDNNRSAVDAVNLAAREATGNIFIVVSDDTDCPDGWDDIIRSTVIGKSDYVIKFADGIQKRIITMPVMDRVYYNRDNHIYNPIYKHAWCDTELTDVAEIRGRIIKRLDVMFRHLHPEVTKEERDALQLRNDRTHDEHRDMYQRRKRMNFGIVKTI